MNEWDAFDRELADSMTDLPPLDTAQNMVTPWKHAMEHIVLGLCLTCFTLNFLFLQYLLPAAGAVHLYLGFRSLRGNNRWFRLCWIVSGCNAILLYTGFLLDATPFSGAGSLYRTALVIALRCLLFFFFRQALRRAAADLGQPSAGDPMLWALVWYAVMLAFALFWPTPGFFPFLAVLAAFICIVRSLLRVTAKLDGWGYRVQTASVKISSGQLKALYYASLAALILILSLFSNHLPIYGTALEQTSDTVEIAAIRTSVEDLGFPENLLESLPGDEIEKLAETTVCYVVPSGQNDLDDANAHLETVFVQIGPSTLRIYQFFAPEGFRPLLRSQVESQRETGSSISDLTAGLCWTSGGENRRASLPIAAREWINYFGDTQQSWQVTFNYPLFSQQRRGWIASTSSYDGDFSCITYTSYTAQRLWNLYPYQTEPSGIQSTTEAILDYIGGVFQPYDS